MRLIAVLACLGLAACSLPDVRSLPNRYTDVTRQLDLFPVYPPRDDVQLGDIFLLVRLKDAPFDVTGAKTYWVGNIPQIQEIAEAHLSNRLVFQDTGADNKTPQKDLPGGRFARRSDNPALSDSLPVVAFPSVTARAGGATGLAGFEILRSTGFGFGARSNVTLSFNDVRGYAAPIVQSRGAIQAGFRQHVERYFARDMATLVDLLPGDSPCFEKGIECSYAVVSKVLMTRKITFGYNNARFASGSRTGIDIPLEDAAKRTPPTQVNVAVSVPTQTDPAAEIGAAAGEIEAIRTQLAALQAQGQASRGIAFEGFTGSGIAFSETFLKPVVIAWEGMTFPLETPREVVDAVLSSQSL